MDLDIKQLSTEERLGYIKEFVEKSSGCGLTVQFFHGKWRVAIDGIAAIEVTTLKDGLGWICMHIKKKLSLNPRASTQFSPRSL
jgi:hypothetical protein